jgi:phosphoglycolate phosphatase
MASRQQKRLAASRCLAHDDGFMFKHIIWDWNGTLLDDAQACAQAINVLLQRRHLPAVSFQQYLDVFDFPVRDYYLQLGFDFSKDDWHSVAEEYHAVYAVMSAQSPLREGTLATLQALQSKGVLQSVLSACELTLLHRMMNERGVLGFFEHVYGLSDLFAHSKVDLGHTLLNDSGLAPGEALLIGDTTHDFEVARAIGVPCLLMTGGHQSETKLRSCGCPVVSSLKGVLEYILK